MFTNHTPSPARAACKSLVLTPLLWMLWAAPQQAQAQKAQVMKPLDEMATQPSLPASHFTTSAVNPLDEMATVEQREAKLHNPFNACKADTGASIGKQILGFFNTGGYFLTGNGKSDANFGSPKFYNDARIYARPRRMGGLELSGGGETLLLSDHFVPFTGGNEYDLLGASAMLSTPRGENRLRLFVTGGLFYGRLRSVNRGFDRSALVPSGSVGAEYPINKTFSLEATYRVSSNINGVNTDGFSVSIKLQ